LTRACCRRHSATPRSTNTSTRLEPNEAFLLVNDHDPKPLYYQFDAEAGPEFRWAYRQQGPEGWRVLIGKWDLAA